jgi:hypothetical protein
MEIKQFYFSMNSPRDLGIEASTIYNIGLIIEQALVTHATAGGWRVVGLVRISENSSRPAVDIEVVSTERKWVTLSLGCARKEFESANSVGDIAYVLAAAIKKLRIIVRANEYFELVIKILDRVERLARGC